MFPTKKSKAVKKSKKARYHLEPMDDSYPKKGKLVSFSQYQKYNQCPKSWKLRYIDKHKQSSTSMHLVFGEVIHEIVQEYLTMCFNGSVADADKIDHISEIKTRLVAKYTEVKDSLGKHFSSSEELEEFFWDGVAIMNELKKRRREFFSTKDFVLLAIELPVKLELRTDIWMISYLDIVLYNQTDDILLIVDLKSSTRGWTKEDKSDKIKGSQLVLYKQHFSTAYNVPIEKIDVEFIILKRKVYENTEFPQKRLQRVIPSHGPKTTKGINKSFDTFLDEIFNDDGSYNQNREYKAISGDKDKNCKFCPYVDLHTLCKPSERNR
mgnify:CR=1 FL=1